MPSGLRGKYILYCLERFLFRQNGAGQNRREAYVLSLRNMLLRGLSSIPAIRFNGDLKQRIAGNLNIIFEGIEGESILLLLDEQGIDPKEAVMVGDDAVCDIEGAKTAGLTTIYVHSNLSPDKESPKADYVFEKMDLMAVQKILMMD